MVNFDRKWLATLREKTTSQRVSAGLQYPAHDPTPLVANDKSTIKRRTLLISKLTESEFYPSKKSHLSHNHDAPGRTIKLPTIQIPFYLLL